MLRPIDAATVELAPGVSAHHSPGRTPGHYVVRVFYNDETSYLLGDVVHHPLQLNDQRISFLSEAEPERTLRVREELLTALQGRNVSIGMAHFPGPGFPADHHGEWACVEHRRVRWRIQYERAW